MKRNTHSDLRVVRYQPGRRLRQFFILLGFSVAAGVLGFILGVVRTEFNYRDSTQTREELASQVERLREDNTRLMQLRINLERGSEIDQQAIRDAQRTISELETNVSQLNSDLSFYKNIMAPGEVETNLQVQRMQLTPGDSDDHFAFSLSLTQVGDNRSYISGQVAVNIVGERDGERAVIPLRDLSEAVDELGVAFRFRYFQDVSGELVIPDDFRPETIQITAQAEGKKAARVERTFAWTDLTGE